MSSSRKAKTIGILGGMGPQATVDLFRKIVLHTPASCDQEHLPILIYNNPAIPPRSSALTDEATSPLPELLRSARKLEEAGADFIVMPCHTAHRWTRELRSSVDIPFLSMIEHTVSVLEAEVQSDVPILLLATETTIRHKLYPCAARGTRLCLVAPEAGEQTAVDEAIARMKAGSGSGRWLAPLEAVLERYYQSGINRYLAACTEIPLLQPLLNTSMTCIDPTLLLAKLAISRSLDEYG